MRMKYRSGPRRGRSLRRAKRGFWIWGMKHKGANSYASPFTAKRRTREILGAGIPITFK